MTATTALPSSPVEPRPRSRQPLWPECLTLVLYAALLAFAIPFHEPWADEAQAWQMARALPLHHLLFHALRYEASPGLWHVFLRALVLLHVSYTGMHWIVALIAVAGVSILIFRAPFPRWVRLALPFTVFLAFQYAVVARSYVLVPLLTFAAAALWKKNSLLVAAALGLLANTSLHGFALAGSLALVYIVETLRGLHRPSRPAWSLLILAALFAFALFTALPPPHDLSFRSDFLHKPLLLRLEAAPYWGLQFLLKAVARPLWLSTPIVLAILWIIARYLGVLYLLPILGVAALSSLSYFNYWHFGFLVIALIAIAWIAMPATPIRTPRLLWPIRALVLLGLAVQIAYSAFAFSWDHNHPYAPAKATAAFLAPFVHRGAPLALTTVNTTAVGAFDSVGLGPYFDHPIFLNQPRLYWLWSSTEHTDADFNAALNQHPAAIVAIYTSKDHLFQPSDALTSQPLRPIFRRGYRVTRVFCGQMPEGFTLAEQTCDVILEP